MSDDFIPPEGFTEANWLTAELSPSRKRRLKQRQKRREGPVFMDQPRTVRRNKAVSIGYRVQCDMDGHGVFTSHQILPGSREWEVSDQAPVCHWADFLFVSKGPKREGIYYNAYARTVAMEAVSKIEKLAKAAIEAKLTPEDKHASRLRIFERKCTGRSGGTEMVFAPHATLPSLGNLTVEAAQAKWLRERWDQLETLVEVCPEAQIKRDYRAGLGLEMIVDYPTLDTRAIAKIVEDFWARGEVAYTDKPADLTAYMPQIKAMLEATLWRWDKFQADAVGAEDPPNPSDEALRAWNVQSAPIRM